MTPEFPPNNPRAELEARLTAFILGELPAHDAAALRQTIDDDPELAALYDRLNAAHKLVREAVASPAEPSKESATPLRLSETRRQKLLAQFKTVAPKEFAPQKKPVISRQLLQIAAVLAIIGLLASVLLSRFSISPHEGESLQFGETSSRLTVASAPAPAAALRTVHNYTQTPPPAQGQADVTSSGAEVSQQIARNLLEDVTLPQHTTPPAKTTIILPPMENSDNGDVALTWKTQDGSTQPPVVFGNIPRVDTRPSSGGTGGSLGQAKANTTSTTLSGYVDTSLNRDNGIAANRSVATDEKKDGFDFNSVVTNSFSAGAYSLGLSTNNSTAQVGDPEWIGYLEHPNQRHSASNSFLSRGAFVAIPQDNSLDANSIHNQSKSQFAPRQPYSTSAGRGFYDDVYNTDGVSGSNGTALGAYDNATKYRKLTRTFDDSAAPGVAANSAEFAQPGYSVKTGSPEVLTAPEVTTGSGRQAVLSGDIVATTGLPYTPPQVDVGAKFADVTTNDNRALGFNWNLGNFSNGTANIIASGGTQLSFNNAAPPPNAPGLATVTGIYTEPQFRGEASRQANKAQSPRAAAAGNLGGETSDFVAGRSGADAPAPTTQYYTLRSPVPYVTGTYFGGINGQAASQYAYVPADKVPRLEVATESGRESKAESPRAAESSQSFSGIGALNNGVFQNSQQFVETTPKAGENPAEPQPVTKPAEASRKIVEIGGNLGGSTQPVPVRSLNTVGLSPVQPADNATDSFSADKKQDSDTNVESVHVVGYVNLNATNNSLDLEADGKKETMSSPAYVSTNGALPSTGQRTSEFTDNLHALGLKAAGAAKSSEPILHAGETDFPDMSVNELLDAYGKLTGRNIIASPNLPSARINLTSTSDLTESQAKQAIESALAMNGVSLVNVGTNAAKAFPVATVGTLGSSFAANGTSPGNMTIAVDPETRRAVVVTDEAVRRSASVISLKDLDRQVKEQEDKLDGLRKGLNIVDTDPQSTQAGSTLGPVNVLHYNSLKIEAETQYAKEEELLAKLKGLDNEQLKLALPTVAPDSILAQLQQDRTATESLLQKQKSQFGPNHPDVQRTEKQLAEDNKQIDGRVKGIVQGMEITAKALKAQAQNSEDKLNDARTNDINIANETRPYYEAKARLSKLIAERDQTAREISGQGQVPAQYAKASDISGALKTLGDNQKNDGYSAAYREKKAELERLKKFQEIMALRVAQDSPVLTMPTTEMVSIIEHADGKPSQNLGLGQRIGRMFTGKETQTARIKVERDVTDVPGVSGQANMAGVYDPYFVQTEFEVIRSEKILDQVIDKLSLDKVWAAQKGSTVPLTKADTRALLKKNLELAPAKNTSLMDIKVKSDKPEEAAKIANTIAEVYQEYRKQQREDLIEGGTKAAKIELAEQQKKIAQVEQELDELRKTEKVVDEDVPAVKHSTNAPIPQPEITTAENAFSTFSLNISDVSLKLAAASLEKGQMPDAASIRSEEFINAFDYRDPEPAPGAPLGFAWERAQYPFAHNRDLLRFAVKTAATGREPGRPLNIVLLLDKSGSMERADRVRIIHEALRVLATQLQPQDKISVVTFARVARLWVDGLSGSQAGEVADGLDQLTPEGGTNLEEAMRLAYETARRHYLANGVNRVVLLTDGAANLGNVDPDALKVDAEKHRKEGIALDCFGVGWEGYNDDLLEVLSRNGGGRYGFINTPEEAATDFVGQLAGALNVAAYDVKVQVEFNPKRVTNWRQIGYAKHQLTKEQFRDNTVKAAQIAAAESGNGLYAIEVNPNGEGPVATVRVRYRVPGTEDYPEHEYQVPYTGGALPLEQSSPAMRLMGSASAFSEWLASSPFAGEVTTDKLLRLMSGVPETYGADERPKKLEWMLRQAKSLEGK